MSAGRASGRWQGATEAGLRQLELNWVEYKVSSQPGALSLKPQPSRTWHCIKRDKPHACSQSPQFSAEPVLSSQCVNCDGGPLASPILMRLPWPYTKP